MNETISRASERVLTTLLGVLDFHKSVAYRHIAPNAQVVDGALCFDIWSGPKFEMPALISVQLSLADGHMNLTQPGLEADTTHSDYLVRYVDQRRGKSVFELAKLSGAFDRELDEVVDALAHQEITPDVVIGKLFSLG